MIKAIWLGPYRVLEVAETGVLAEKVYAPQDGRIQIYLERVTQCPRNWYGSRRQGPGRPPKWLVTLQQQCARNRLDTSCEDPEPSPNKSPLTSEFSLMSQLLLLSLTPVFTNSNLRTVMMVVTMVIVKQCMSNVSVIRTVKPPIRLTTVNVT